MRRLIAWLWSEVWGRKGVGQGSPDPLAQEPGTSQEVPDTSDLSALDAHQLDRDSLWRLFQERQEQARQAKLQRMLNDIFQTPGYIIEPFRHTGEHSEVVPLDVFDASAKAAIAYVATALRVGLVETKAREYYLDADGHVIYTDRPTRPNGELNGQD